MEEIPQLRFLLPRGVCQVTTEANVHCTDSHLEVYCYKVFKLHSLIPFQFANPFQFF